MATNRSVSKAKLLDVLNGERAQLGREPLAELPASVMNVTQAREHGRLTLPEAAPLPQPELAPSPDLPAAPQPPDQVVKPAAEPAAKPKRERRPRNAAAPAPVASVLSDVNVGKAINGCLSLWGMVPLAKLGMGGNHWRLMNDEELQMGQCFGPLCRMYPGLLEDIVRILMVAPAVANVMGPRVLIQWQLMKGVLPPEQARFALVQARALMAAEDKLQLEQQAAEAAAMLRTTAAQVVQASAGLHAAELRQTVGAPPQPPPQPQQPQGSPPTAAEVERLTASEELPPDLVSTATAIEGAPPQA